MYRINHQKTFYGLFFITLVIALGILIHEQGISLNIFHLLSQKSQSSLIQQPLEETSSSSDSLQQNQQVMGATEQDLPIKLASENHEEKDLLSDYPEYMISEHLALTPANIIWMTNYERVHRGIPPLGENTLLNASANEKNNDMHLYHYFNHLGYRDNLSYGFDYFIKNASYNFLKIGENLAEGDFQNSYELVQAWMKSPEHRKNILDKGFRDIGVSVFIITERDEILREVYVQHFGVSRAMCPNDHLETMRTQYQHQEDELIKRKEYLKELDPAQTETYQQEIDTYNTLIQNMNSAVKKLNKEITDYNQCIGTYIQESH